MVQIFGLAERVGVRGLAECLGCAEGKIWDWVSGKTWLRVSEVRLLSDRFGVPFNVLLEENRLMMPYGC